MNPSACLRGAGAVGGLLLTLTLAQAGPIDAAAPPPANAAATGPRPEAVLAAINQFRARQGLSPWQADARLAAIAAEHSQAQAQQGRLSHGGFQARLARTQARLCVENLAAGARSAQAVVDAWRASPLHLQNLLDPEVDRVGLATTQRVVSMLACRFDPR